MEERSRVTFPNLMFSKRNVLQLPSVILLVILAPKETSHPFILNSIFLIPIVSISIRKREKEIELLPGYEKDEIRSILINTWKKIGKCVTTKKYNSYIL